MAFWSVTEKGVQTDTPAKTLPKAHIPANQPLFAAALAPVAGGRVALGWGRYDRKNDRWLGKIDLWNPEKDAVVSLTLEGVEGTLHALGFSGDGGFLAAGGTSKRLYAWDVRGEAKRNLSLSWRHDEQINTLAALPGPAGLLLSGSDDTTVRLWNLQTPKQPLLGTLALAQSGPNWVTYAPNGLFDGSPEGVRQVSRLSGGALLRLEQLFVRDFQFGLTGDLLAGGPPELNTKIDTADIARMVLELAPAGEGQGRAQTLTLWVGKDDVTDLRLYHNGMVIRDGIEKDLKDGRLSLPVTLTGGANRFYAMGTVTNHPDGRSNEVEVAYDATTNGRLHVLALGVGDYKTAKLQYAKADAQDLGKYLGQHPIQAEQIDQIKPIVLTDEAVNRQGVESAFNQIREDVRKRPEDTVVVFLAGHTDLRDDRYCLLLPGAELTGPAVAHARGQGVAVKKDAPTANDPTLLPYAEIHRRLAGLDALNRLVIVDACQAEAILDDPFVKRIQRLVDQDSRKSRTSYLMAARKGELAGEAPELKHGLLTYTVLHGLGDPSLARLDDLKIFDERPNADLNGDKRIDTDELRTYVRALLPPLTAHFSDLVGRAGEAMPPPGRHERPLRYQTVTAAPFPLAKLP